MAGDWIKMRVDLQDDPAVVSLCDSLDMDEFAVIGRLHKLWAWADKHTSDGCSTGVTPKWLDRFVNAQGFFAALESVGWIAFVDGVLSFPSFDIHNGRSAKNRCDQATRQRASRTRHDSVTKKRDEVVTKALPEKRREEKSIKERGESENQSPFLETRSVEFLEAWERWKRHSRDNGKPIGVMSEESQLVSLAAAYPVEAEAIKAIEFSLKNNWRNIDLKNSHSQKDDKPRPAKASSESKLDSIFKASGL